MDYKDTLLLPTTDFAMRGNLPECEPARYAKWDEQKVYEKMKAKREKSAISFNIHDGPPYANGHLHIGHALNKILKDIILKTHYFFGQGIRYTPGWDCHGLPIEQQVEVKLGDKKKSMSKSDIRQECRNWAKEFIT
ncbi:class I tRNA ligase family protein, partial [Campylobacter fetus]